MDRDIVEQLERMRRDSNQHNEDLLTVISDLKMQVGMLRGVVEQMAQMMQMAMTNQPRAPYQPTATDADRQMLDPNNGESAVDKARRILG